MSYIQKEKEKRFSDGLDKRDGKWKEVEDEFKSFGLNNVRTEATATESLEAHTSFSSQDFSLELK